MRVPGILTLSCTLALQIFVTSADVLARAGAHTAYTIVTDRVEVADGVFEVHLMSVTGESMLSGIMIEPVGITSVAPARSEGPLRFELSQNYPNPFNPSTVIRFHLPALSGAERQAGTPGAGQVTLKVYDLLGCEVATLVDGKMDPGEHRIAFDAGTGSVGGTRALSSGVYLYFLRVGSYSETRTMLLLR